MLHTQPKDPRRAQSHSGPYEPSDEWKAEVRDRIRNEAKQMQHQAIQNLRDDWLKQSKGDPEPYNHPDFKRKSQNIERQVQTWANDSYRSELEKEINLSKLMAGESVEGDWKHILEEQEAIMKQIEESKGQSMRRGEGGRVDTDDSEDSPTFPNLGASVLSPSDKPSDIPFSPMERRDSVRRTSQYSQEDTYSPTAPSGSTRQRPPQSRRAIPEFWTPPSETEEIAAAKPPFRRNSNASVRSVNSQTGFRAPIAAATIPERGPVPTDTYERGRTGSNNAYQPQPAAGTSPVHIQLDQSGRGERNRAGSVNSNRSFNSGSFPERPNSFTERERNSPFPPTPDGYSGSDGERAYFARSPSNSIPNINRGPPPVTDADYERPASVQSGMGGYRIVPDRSPGPTFVPPPPYQHHISPNRERPAVYDRNLADPAAPEWLERRWSQATNYGPYTRPESAYDYAPPQPSQTPAHDYPSRPTIDTLYGPAQADYDSQPVYHASPFFEDQSAYSPEEEYTMPDRTESRMKFHATGWVSKNGSDHLPPDLVRQFKMAASSYNMDNYDSLPRQERQLWLRIEQVAHNLTKQKEDLDQRKEEADRMRKEAEREKDEAKKREEALKEQADQLKLREYNLIFREKEVEFNAKLREKEDQLKLREEELNRRMYQAEIDKAREEEQKRLDRQREEEDRIKEKQREQELRQLAKEREEERRRAEDDRRREMEESRQAKAALLQELQAQRERDRQEEARRRADLERVRMEELRREERRLEEEEKQRRLRQAEEEAKAEARRLAEEEEKERQRRQAEEEEKELRRRQAEEERLEAERKEEEAKARQAAKEEERRIKKAREEERMRKEQAAEEAKWREAERKRREAGAEIERQREEERRQRQEEKWKVEEEERRLRKEEAEKKRKQAEEEEQHRRMLAEEEVQRKAEEEQRRRSRAQAVEAAAARDREERARRAAAQAKQDDEDEALRRLEEDEEHARELERQLREEEEKTRIETERLRREEQQRRDEAKLEAELNRIHEKAARAHQEAQSNGDSQDRQRKSDESSYDPHERYRSGLYTSSTPPRRPHHSSSTSQPFTPERSSSTSSWTSASATGWESWGKVPAAASSTSAYSSARSTPQRAPSAPANFSKPTTSTSNVPNPQPAPTRTPLSSAEWARRQAEHAKKQQEQFILEQERMERARQEKLSKSLSKEDVMQTFEWHERMWVRLSEADTLTWDSFPWPLLKKPSSPDDITTVGLSAYVLSPLGPGKEKPNKDRIKEQIRRWHPDRFETKLLHKVEPSQTEQVKAGAGAVVRGLNELLARTNTSAAGGGLFG